MGDDGDRFFGCDGDVHYEWKWEYGASKPKANENGISGWAKLISRSSGIQADEGTCRVHLCAHDPCKAVYPASKYGCIPPPMHLQPSDWRPPSFPTLVDDAAVAAEMPPDLSGASSSAAGDGDALAAEAPPDLPEAPLDDAAVAAEMPPDLSGASSSAEIGRAHV